MGVVSGPCAAAVCGFGLGNYVVVGGVLDARQGSPVVGSFFEHLGITSVVGRVDEV